MKKICVCLICLIFIFGTTACDSSEKVQAITSDGSTKTMSVEKAKEMGYDYFYPSRPDVVYKKSNNWEAN